MNVTVQQSSMLVAPATFVKVPTGQGLHGRASVVSLNKEAASKMLLNRKTDNYIYIHVFVWCTWRTLILIIYLAKICEYMFKVMFINFLALKMK